MNWMMKLGAVALALALTACATPPPPQFSQQDVLQIAIATEQEIRSELGKRNGRKKDWKYVDVSRQGTKVTATAMFLDPVVVDNMTRLKDRPAVRNIIDALAVKQICDDPEAAAAVRSGFVMVLNAVDPKNRPLFSSTVDAC